MKISGRFIPYKLQFKRPAGTSRGVLHEKESWFFHLQSNGKTGMGECSLIPGLSPDPPDTYLRQLQILTRQPEAFTAWKTSTGMHYPSIQFGMETAFSDLETGSSHIFSDNAFTRGEKGIPINGLIWMGEPGFMKQQIREKIEQGFRCIKIKIGAIDFKQELSLIRMIRQQFDANTIEIRLDANGAFKPDEVLEKLNQLSHYQIHSIEQPIRPGQYENMSILCKQSPVAIALDEELIGIHKATDQQKLLEQIKPQYIILKPSLLGGLKASDQWIGLAISLGIGWWATSALESNIGLNSIAQWAFTINNPLPQGLGTGALYTNNFDSPLEIQQGKLFYNPEKAWNLQNLYEV